ncbi:MAG: GTPase HflX [Candidatus Zixiibacteriota bacterium]
MKKLHEIDNGQRSERVLLVGLSQGRQTKTGAMELLAELAELARSAGAEVIDTILQRRPAPDPATYIGSGTLDQIKRRVDDEDIDSVIFDDPLSPAQQRNLEDQLQVKALDRSRLILDIFATRARTAEAMAQVELAQLQYLLPRLTRAWTHLSRQHGAIGVRGPGETQLEVDRRRIRVKIAHLKRRLEKIGAQRHLRRKGRDNLFKIAFVGYTNTGKSTLFNRLTRAEVGVADRLFMTLDPTSRIMSTPYPRRVIFTDTVGFIRKLPHELVESFKSTLEEAVLADLLIHVIDCSDELFSEKTDQTDKLLREIGASAPTVSVFNKLDLNPEFLPPPLPTEAAFAVSAITGRGLDKLRNYLIERAQLQARAAQPAWIQ